ncbi:MAG: 6-phospho-3-hexuloisomerase [Candidatus Bathyarchaeota archaeon]|nr:MAG: 6-phospho-3-hexuloisomerase [Candidatus Bathyarchaeota archaeon]
MSWWEAAEEILSGISKAIDGLDHDQVERMLETLLLVREEGRKALVVGAGRSGLVGKAFAMRLMHLGFDVYVMGETITPAIGSGDLVLIISGSGSGAMSTTAARLAKRLGSRILAVTSYPESELGKAADHVVVVPGREIIAREQEYQARQLLGEHESLAPMGTLFEDSCTIFLDSIVAEIMARLEISEEAMKSKHSTIE